MKINWQAEDGYAGGSRPQSFTIKDDEVLDNDDVDSAMEMIRDYIQQDFENKVSTSYNEDKIRAEVEKLFANKPKDE